MSSEDISKEKVLKAIQNQPGMTLNKFYDLVSEKGIMTRRAIIRCLNQTGRIDHLKLVEIGRLLNVSPDYLNGSALTGGELDENGNIIDDPANMPFWMYNDTGLDIDDCFKRFLKSIEIPDKWIQSISDREYIELLYLVMDDINCYYRACGDLKRMKLFYEFRAHASEIKANNIDITN